MLERVFFLLLLFLSSVPAVAESQQHTRYHTYLSFNSQASELEVETTFVIPSDVLHHGTASFFLNKNFEIHSIAGETLKNHTWRVSERIPSWNILELAFSADAPYHELHISYRGTINFDAGHGNHIESQSAHLSIDSGWHPVFSDFSTSMRGTLDVVLPAGWSLYGPGRVEQIGDGYRLISNEKTIDVSMYATTSDNEIVSERFTVIHEGQSQPQAEQLADMGNDCLKSLNNRFAAGNPLSSASMVLLERAGPSFARANYLSVTSDALAGEEQNYHYICHELAHRWTAYGDVMSHNYWMAESFAEYVAAQEVQSRFGAEAYAAVVESWEEKAKGHDVVWRAEVKERAPAMVNYALGPLALRKLEQRIGTDSFNKLLSHYMTTPLTETEALLSELERLSTPETRQWFKQVLHGKQSE